jgi:hypothetical protein
MASVDPDTAVLERMVRAVEKVRQRLLRAVAALEEVGVPYALAGGNAVAAWVATVDEAAVRSTQDVDIVLQRSDLERARQALERAGFVYRHSAGVDMFLDGPGARARDSVHVLFAGEKVRPTYPEAVPSVDDSTRLSGQIQVLSLDGLVRMKLTSFRRKHQVHLLDMAGVGLVGEQTIAGLPRVLAERLRELLSTPDD